MNKKKGDKGFESPRPFKLTHQVLCINNINFQKKSLIGYVELTIFPYLASLNKIRLNCKQCLIYRVRVNDYEAAFIYNDPTLEVCHHETKQRNLAFFSSAYAAAVQAVEADSGNGELCIKIPSELREHVEELRGLKVHIEFWLDQPKGGLQFVVPELEESMAERAAHVFSYGHQNASRFWFPCIDSYSELCTWKMEFTVDASMVAVSNGDLTETIYTSDMRHISSQVTHFCLPHLLPLLKHTTTFLHEIFEFYEEILTCRYPFSCYKTVFVDEAYTDASSYASMSIFSTSLLHGSSIVDQTPITRKRTAKALAQQFFGCFISRISWTDDWVLKGISGYIYGLWMKKTFGSNEYNFWIKKWLTRVTDFELQNSGILLHPTFPSGKDKESPTPHLHFSTRYPHTLPCEYYKLYQAKAHLVLRLIENRISMEFLLQVFNKLLSLANTASSQRYQSHMWSQMLLSTAGFLKSISIVSGKDIQPLIRQWVEQSGVVKFFGTFVFNRKRNILELELKQDCFSQGTQKYVGPLTVTVQELDGSFNHNLQIEENSTRHEIPCHSKSRRNKKKKIPLMNGEEVDMDLSAMDSDSPLLWIRVDPGMTLLRRISFEQPDFMWQYQLRYERSVAAQLEAIRALERYPTPASRLALTDILEHEQCFYRVRLEATQCLAKVANAMVNTWSGPPAMKSLFTRMFCCKSCANIIKTNNFSNFQGYFLQKNVPIAMAKQRDAHGLCPKEVLTFILDLIKYNDNRKNKFSDNYYRAALIEALANTITPAVAASNESRTVEGLHPDAKLVLEEITRFLNMEKLLPCYRHTVTASCLRAVRVLQKNGHIPSEPGLFQAYAQYGIFIDVRLAALHALVDYTRVDTSSEILQWLLHLVQNDPVSFVRHKILTMLIEEPPLFRKSESTLCTEALVDQLWKLINSGTAHDSRLRCDAVDLYHALFGLGRPACLPLPELGLVVNLKEKKTVLNPTIKPEAGAAVSENASSSAGGKQSLVSEGANGKEPGSGTSASQGTKRKADSPPAEVTGTEGVTGRQDDDNNEESGKVKVRIRDDEEVDINMEHDTLASPKTGLEDYPSTQGSEPVVAGPESPTTQAARSARASPRNDHHHEHRKKKKKHRHKHKHKRRHDGRDSLPFLGSPASARSFNSLSTSD
uniref:transcription initiation factor TFIID subunit 2 isoform X2 n=1 Tax=Myxine glutinosa TaxID=7769 RepID=UPI00358F3A99